MIIKKRYVIIAVIALAFLTGVTLLAKGKVTVNMKQKKLNAVQLPKL